MKKHMMKKHILIICTTQNEKAFITKTLWWRSTQRRIWYSLYREAYEEAYDEESYDGARGQAETLLKTIRWAAKKLTNGACDCLHSAIDHCAKDCALFFVQSNTVQKHCVKKDCALLHRAIQHCAIEHCANEHCAKDAVQMAHVIVCTVQKILPFFIVNSSTVRYLSKWMYQIVSLSCIKVF